MGRTRGILTMGILAWPLLLASGVAGDEPRRGERYLRFRVGDTTAMEPTNSQPPREGLDHQECLSGLDHPMIQTLFSP